MKQTHRWIPATFLCLGVLPIAGSPAKASERGHGAGASPLWEHSASQRGGRRQTRKREQPQTTPSVSHDLERLREQFNRDKGQVRLLLILSPT